MPDFPGAWAASGGRQRDGLACQVHPVLSTWWILWSLLPTLSHQLTDRLAYSAVALTYNTALPAAAYPHALNNCTAETPSLQFECIPMDLALQNYMLPNSHYTFKAFTFCDTEHNLSCTVTSSLRLQTSCLCPVCLFICRYDFVL